MANKTFNSVKILPTFTKASSFTNLVSKENICTSLGKLMKWYDTITTNTSNINKALGETRIYINFDTGVDTNAGTTAATAVKTLSRAFALMKNAKNCLLTFGGDTNIYSLTEAITFENQRIRFAGISSNITKISCIANGSITFTNCNVTMQYIAVSGQDTDLLKFQNGSILYGYRFSVIFGTSNHSGITFSQGSQGYCDGGTFGSDTSGSGSNTNNIIKLTGGSYLSFGWSSFSSSISVTTSSILALNNCNTSENVSYNTTYGGIVFINGIQRYPSDFTKSIEETNAKIDLYKTRFFKTVTLGTMASNLVYSMTTIPAAEVKSFITSNWGDKDLNDFICELKVYSNQSIIANANFSPTDNSLSIVARLILSTGTFPNDTKINVYMKYCPTT